MSWLDAFRQRAADLFTTRGDRELREEIDYHLELETSRLIRDGCDPAVARRRALEKFGPTTHVTDATRDARGSNPTEGSMQDFHWAIRSLRKNPAFTALALVTLVLGIGAATVAFTVLDTVLLRPLPYRDANRLVMIRERTDEQVLLPPSYPNFVSWRESARSFDGVASAMMPYSTTVWPSPSAPEPLRVPIMGVSRHFFATLGVTPEIGREFTDDENAVGGRWAAMVTHEFWQTNMGGRQPLGAIRLFGEIVPVVGVLPPGFRFAAQVDVFFPHERMPGTVRNAHNYIVVGRLKPAVTLDAARADMTSLSRRLLAEYGNETQAVDADVLPLRDYFVADYRIMLSVVFGAASLVLLIACTNLVTAQLARGTAREREIVVRAALGASRARLARQLLLESVVLVVVGAVSAAVLALAATRGIKSVGQNLVPRLSELSVDPRVLGFVSAIAVVTTLIVGVYPAWRLANRDAGLVLRGARDGATIRATVWRLLVGFEIALALMLLVGSALLVRTLHNILTADTGFNPHGIVTASIAPPNDVNRLDEVLTELRTVPGVQGAALTNRVPLLWGVSSAPVRRPGDPGDHDWPAMAGFRVVSPDYFSVLQQPILRGRAFTTADAANAPGVAIVTPGIAGKLWPGQDPIGRTISSNYAFNQWLTVVGVVREASNWSMPRGTQNEIYVPLAQHPKSLEGQVVAMLRTSGSTDAIAPALRARLHALVPKSPAQISTMDTRIANSAADRRFAMLALTAFSAIAIVLAAVGIYGVIWYIVSTRTHEIGIRMALGATAAMVRRNVLGNALMMTGGGVIAGLACGAFATRYLRASLYGVSPLDVSVYIIGALIVLGTAILAAYVPARRSSRVDPMVAIRGE
ncbi:MAG TPA: ABC transporter permease [Gemmatimonadaceae bacterium]|nr:ABC transporter permease [Gemmatimonadaceae bacterium]